MATYVGGVGYQPHAMNWTRGSRAVLSLALHCKWRETACQRKGEDLESFAHSVFWNFTMDVATWPRKVKTLIVPSSFFALKSGTHFGTQLSMLEKR